MAKAILERFFEKVELIPFTTCWVWSGCAIGRIKKAQYGLFTTSRGAVLAHRFSWEIHNKAEIPYGMHVLHRCDVSLCVNPAHLFLGTHQDNMTDMRLKGRAVGHSGEMNATSKLTGDDVEFIRQQRRLGVTCVKLANDFSVVPSTISRISGGRGWKIKTAKLSSA